MSEMSNRPVDNGERLRVECAFFKGMAGVRRDKAGGQFACAARFKVMKDAIAGTVDGRAVRITTLRKSDIAEGLLVAEYEYEGEA